MGNILYGAFLLLKLCWFSPVDPWLIGTKGCIPFSPLPSWLPGRFVVSITSRHQERSALGSVSANHKVSALGSYPSYLALQNAVCNLKQQRKCNCSSLVNEVTCFRWGLHNQLLKVESEKRAKNSWNEMNCLQMKWIAYMVHYHQCYYRVWLSLTTALLAKSQLIGSGVCHINKLYVLHLILY